MTADHAPLRDPRFDVLFQPVPIGHLVARNRFYQSPHCNGMGNLRPQAHVRMRAIKGVTTKPVVGVGRFTSPDTMAGLIRRGVLDMIGAARPSIADPFLPKKIEEGRIDDIRECIGCNICVSGHFAMTNLRCTQNPTMGEEWRRGWHPERIAPAAGDRTVLVVGADQVVLATGATWRADGVGRNADRPLPLDDMAVLTPDDIMAGREAGKCVVIYDDDHYYMGAVLAEKLVLAGHRVTLVTPAAAVSAFTFHTLENLRTARRLHELGAAMVTHNALVAAADGAVQFRDVRTGAPVSLAADALVLVTARMPENRLYLELAQDPALGIARIGDCEAPGALFAAIYSGHRFAREFDDPRPVLNRERIALGGGAQ